MNGSLFREFEEEFTRLFFEDHPRLKESLEFNSEKLAELFDETVKVPVHGASPSGRQIRDTINFLDDWTFYGSTTPSGGEWLEYELEGLFRSLLEGYRQRFILAQGENRVQEEETEQVVEHRAETVSNRENSTALELPQPKFDPRKFGGKELCIVVSYKKAGKRDQLKLAKILKNKAHIEYPGAHKDPVSWQNGNPQGFNNHLYRLRKKAEDNSWWESIPADYYLKYT